MGGVSSRVDVSYTIDKVCLVHGISFLCQIVERESLLAGNNERVRAMQTLSVRMPIVATK